MRADRPDIVRRERANAGELAASAEVWTRNDQPAGAVPMLDQRLAPGAVRLCLETNRPDVRSIDRGNTRQLSDVASGAWRIDHGP